MSDSTDAMHSAPFGASFRTEYTSASAAQTGSPDGTSRVSVAESAVPAPAENAGQDTAIRRDGATSDVLEQADELMESLSSLDQTRQARSVSDAAVRVGGEGAAEAVGSPTAAPATGRTRASSGGSARSNRSDEGSPDGRSGKSRQRGSLRIKVMPTVPDARSAESSTRSQTRAGRGESEYRTPTGTGLRSPTNSYALSPSSGGDGSMGSSRKKRSPRRLKNIKSTASVRKLLKVDHPGVLGYDVAGYPITPIAKDPYRVPEAANINFLVHGHVQHLAPRSLYLFGEDSRIRQFCIWLGFHEWFDYFIIFVITCNSVLLALSDYRVENLDPVTFLPDPQKGWRNQLQEQATPVFTVIFVLEFLVKIIAMGFFVDTGSYLRDAWNWLDFSVVVSSVLDSIPGIPTLNVLRVFRVLRPLRTIRVLPGMRLLVASLLNSIPSLANVFALLMFVFFMFGILGLQLWTGVLHSRCRLTKYPVRMPDDVARQYISAVHQLDVEWEGGKAAPLYAHEIHEQVVHNRTAFPFCSDEEGNPILLADVEWTQATSPWIVPKQCVWPLARNDTRLCSMGGGGDHDCPADQVCGSNYDAYGNARFVNREIMEEALWKESLMWGFMNFDDIGRAFLSIFQSITLEGWVDIMYLLQDSHNSIFAAIYFTLLVMMGAFFLLNLTLAVIWGNLAALKAIAANEIGSNVSVMSSADVPNSRAAQHSLADDDSRRLGSEVSLVSNVTPVSLDRKSGATKVMPLAKTAADRAAHASGRSLKRKHSKKSLKIRARFALFKMVNHKVFSSAIVGLILVNTVVLAMDQHPMDAELNDTLEDINLVLTLAFTVEMVLKLLALGAREYVRDMFNTFDAIIVIISLTEIVLAAAAASGDTSGQESGGGISALRTFRLFRVFKLAKNWVSLRMLLNTILATVKDVANFVLLLSLFMYIAALLGQQFFANRFRFDEDFRPVSLGDPGFDEATVPRANFDTLTWSVVTIFQMLSAENWPLLMYDAWKAVGIGSTVYFVVTVALGNFIVLNLFLAILLGNFEGMEEKTAVERVKIAERARQRRLEQAAMFSSTRNLMEAPLPSAESAPKSFSGSFRSGGVVAFASQLRRQVESVMNGSVTKPATAVAPAPTEGALATASDDGISRSQSMRRPMLGRSLCLLSVRNPVRVACWHIVHHRHFDNVVLFLIAVSSILLAIDSPLNDPTNTLGQTISLADKIITILFLLESLLKIVTFGLIVGRGAYMRSGWNVLDFSLVIISLLSWAASSSGSGGSLKSLRSLRSLRALRPLRVISRNPGMKLVVNALFRAIPSIVNVMFVCMLFFLIFGIVGVNYFKGTFMACQGVVFEDFTPEQLQLLHNPLPFAELSSDQRQWGPSHGYVGANSRVVCQWMGATWEEVIPQHFDNIGAAAGTLYEMTTKEGWMNVLYAGVDATGIDSQPIKDYNPGWTVFFCLFIVVGAFFTMNLFVGVVIDNFNRMKDEMGESVLLTPNQKEWVKMQEAMQHLRPRQKYREPRSRVRGFLFRVTQHEAFEGTIVTCILLNTVSMSLEHFGQAHQFGQFLEGLNDVFALVFTLEAVFKLIALKLAYFNDSWNRFDFAIVVGTDVGILISWLGIANVGGVATVVRTFRAGRVVRLIHSAKSLRTLFNTLIVTLPSLGNIGSLLFLLYFIYAVMGVQVFAHVQFGDYLNVHANFRSLGTAIMLLLRASTGEGWNSVMYELAASPDGCTTEPLWSDEVPRGCGSEVAFPFFISFTLLVAFVMLNVFIAVILEGFSDMSEAEESILSKDQLAVFSRLWTSFDPDATLFITEDQLAVFMTLLPAPMGFAHDLSIKEQNEAIAHMNLPAYSGNRVHFADVAKGVARLVFEELLRERGEELQEIPESHGIVKKWKKLKEKGGVEETKFSVRHMFAAQTIAETVAVYRFRKRQLELGMRSPRSRRASVLLREERELQNIPHAEKSNTMHKINMLLYASTKLR